MPANVVCCSNEVFSKKIQELLNKAIVTAEEQQCFKDFRGVVRNQLSAKKSRNKRKVDLSNANCELNNMGKTKEGCSLPMLPPVIIKDQCMQRMEVRSNENNALKSGALKRMNSNRQDEDGCPKRTRICNKSNEGGGDSTKYRKAKMVKGKSILDEVEEEFDKVNSYERYVSRFMNSCEKKFPDVFERYTGNLNVLESILCCPPRKIAEIDSANRIRLVALRESMRGRFYREKKRYIKRRYPEALRQAIKSGDVRASIEIAGLKQKTILIATEKAKAIAIEKATEEATAAQSATATAIAGDITAIAEATATALILEKESFDPLYSDSSSFALVEELDAKDTQDVDVNVLFNDLESLSGGMDVLLNDINQRSWREAIFSGDGTQEAGIGIQGEGAVTASALSVEPLQPNGSVESVSESVILPAQYEELQDVDTSFDIDALLRDIDTPFDIDALLSDIDMLLSNTGISHYSI